MSRSDSESIHDFGSTRLTPQIFPISCRSPWNMELAGLETLMRTYTGVELRVERDGSETHAIQVLDEPHQILALQVWNRSLILASTKEVAELLEKLWRSSVEVAEFL